MNWQKPPPRTFAAQMNAAGSRRQSSARKADTGACPSPMATTGGRDKPIVHPFCEAEGRYMSLVQPLDFLDASHFMVQLQRNSNRPRATRLEEPRRRNRDILDDETRTVVQRLVGEREDRDRNRNAKESPARSYGPWKTQSAALGSFPRLTSVAASMIGGCSGQVCTVGPDMDEVAWPRNSLRAWRN